MLRAGSCSVRYFASWTTPTISRSLRDAALPMVMRWPIGSVPRKYVRASVSLTTTTFGDAAVSLSDEVAAALQAHADRLEVPGRHAVEVDVAGRLRRNAVDHDALGPVAHRVADRRHPRQRGGLDAPAARAAARAPADRTAAARVPGSRRPPHRRTRRAAGCASMPVSCAENAREAAAEERRAGRGGRAPARPGPRRAPCRPTSAEAVPIPAGRVPSARP